MLPILATLLQAGLPILAGAVASKGQELVEEKLGVKIGPLLGSEEGQVKLRQLEMEHEATLLEYADRKDARALEYFKEENKDRDSARNAAVAIQNATNASWLSKNTGYIIDLFIVGMTTLMVWTLFFKAVPVDNRDLMLTFLGLLLAKAATVVDFHRGTSRSSQAKDATIAALSKERV